MATTEELSRFVEANFAVDEEDLAENVPFGSNVLEAAVDKCPDCVFVDTTRFAYDAVATFWSKRDHFLVISWCWRHNSITKFVMNMAEIPLSEIKEDLRLEGRLEHLQKICAAAEEEEFRITREDKLTPQLSQVLAFSNIPMPLIRLIAGFVRDPLDIFLKGLSFSLSPNCNLCDLPTSNVGDITALIVRQHFVDRVRKIEFVAIGKDGPAQLGVTLHKPCEVIKDCKECVVAKERALTYVETFPTDAKYFYIEAKDLYKIFCLESNKLLETVLQDPSCDEKRARIIDNGRMHYWRPLCCVCTSWRRQCRICGVKNCEMYRFDDTNRTFCTDSVKKCYRFYYTEAQLPKPTLGSWPICYVCFGGQL
jgi:hypothetical protein